MPAVTSMRIARSAYFPCPALRAGGHLAPAVMAAAPAHRCRPPQWRAARLSAAWTDRSGGMLVEPRGVAGATASERPVGESWGEDGQREVTGGKGRRDAAAARTSSSRSRHGSWAEAEGVGRRHAW